MPQPRLRILTIDDYWHLPDDGKRYEILDGILEVSSPPGVKHQDVVGNLLTSILNFLRDCRLGKLIVSPVDVILSHNSICQPDLVFVRKDRVKAIVKDRIHGAPDLVIEVLSPGSSRRDRITKKHLYAQYGVTEYWIVDTKSRTVSRFVLGPSGYAAPEIIGAMRLLETPLLPGLALSLLEVFADIG